MPSIQMSEDTDQATADCITAARNRFGDAAVRVEA